MVDSVQKPIRASAYQGQLDTAYAAMRLLIVILGTAPAAALVVRKHDLVALYDFFHTQQGTALFGAVCGLLSLAFGLYKSFKRGSQVASVAADPDVPDSVAVLKDASKGDTNA